MNYYLDLFTPYTWSMFQEHGGTVSGYTENMKTRADKIKPGDIFVCYLVRLSRWCGALEVEAGPYIDRSPIFAPENDKFVVRFRVKPLVVLKPEDAIPIGALWDQLKRTKHLDRNRPGWAYAAQVAASLVPIDLSDGQLIVERLLKQSKEPTPFPLDAAGRRLVLQRPVVTPKGPVEVVVPEDTDEEIEVEREPAKRRDSLVVQATLATIGAKMGYSIWIPRNDRAAVKAQMRQEDAEKLLDDLPLNYEDNTLKTVEQIDLLWLRRRSIVRAFEIEHTTAVYSGLLRMADLLALQPNMDIRLHIVADETKREKVFREIRRPVFGLLESGALSDSCSFLSYASVAEISKMPHLSHMTDTIIDEYQEIVE